MKKKDKDQQDELFFKEELWKYCPFLNKLLYTMTLDRDLAEDLAQDTLLKCWKQLAQVRRYRNLKAALAQMARNEFRAYCRKGKTKTFAITDLVEPYKLRWVKESSNLEELLQIESDVRKMMLVLSGIKREHVQVVLLVDYYGFSLKEVAKLLNKKYNTVVSQRARGHEEMKKYRDELAKSEKREI